MPTKIQIRRGTSTQWTSSNPILAAGEFGLETNTGKVKLGNGSTAWSSLAYFGNLENLDNVGDVVITSAATGQVLQFNGTNWVNSDIAISEVTGLQTALDGKAASSHTHAISDVTDLSTTLSGKASTSHTHPLADITSFEVANPVTGQTLQYNGTKWVNAAAASGGETISSFLLMGA